MRKSVIGRLTLVRADELRYVFLAPLVNRYEAASPNSHHWELEYTPKIMLQMKRDKSGGCG